MCKLQLVPPQQRILHLFQLLFSQNEDDLDLYAGGAPHVVIAIDTQRQWRVCVSRKQFSLQYRTPQRYWSGVRLWSKSRLKSGTEEEMLQKAQAALDRILAIRSAEQSSDQGEQAQGECQEGGSQR